MFQTKVVEGIEKYVGSEVLTAVTEESYLLGHNAE
jgi:hypothetical protein